MALPWQYHEESPPPGVVTEDRFGKWATCYICRGRRLLWHDGRFAPHDKRGGEGPCRGEWTAASLDAAIARDEKLTEAERRVQSATWRWLNQCRGPLVDNDCRHPICRERVAQGLRFTLMGWKAEAPADAQRPGRGRGGRRAPRMQ